MCFHCDNGNTKNHIPTEYRSIFYRPRAREGFWYCPRCASRLADRQAEGRSPHLCEGRYIMITTEKPEEKIVGGIPHGFGIWIEGRFHRVKLGLYVSYEKGTSRWNV